MKYICIQILLFLSINLIGQNALHNKGNIKLHENANIGIFCNIVNNSYFVSDKSFIGLYNKSKSLNISGSEPLILHNVETKIHKDLILENSIYIHGNLIFNEGKIICSKNDEDINVHFQNFASTQGSNNYRYIDGYATYTGIQKFEIPLGDQDQQRSIILPIQVQNNYFETVFFYHNPETTLETTNVPVNSKKYKNIKSISDTEFWIVNSNFKSSISLKWAEESNISKLVTDINELTVIGWNIKNEIWDNLGNTKITGNMYEGIITSETFLSSKYSIICLGGQHQGLNPYVDNIGISPNDDGLNDYLLLQAAIDHPDNELIIYDRWGIKIFKQKNYKNDFSGRSTKIKLRFGTKILPRGTYYYVLKLNDIDKVKKGYIYVNY